MKKSTITVSVILIVAVVALVGVYAFITGRARTEELDSMPTEVQTILLQDMSINYPKTPKEVVKYYSRIVRCFYAEGTTDEELEALGMRARELYDDELLANNEVDVYMSRLRSEVKEYRDKKRTITNVSVAGAVNVDYFEEDGYEFARLSCGYNVTEGRNTSQVLIMYLLRKDDSGRWKIYGWANVDPTKVDILSR